MPDPDPPNTDPHDCDPPDPGPPGPNPPSAAAEVPTSLWQNPPRDRRTPRYIDDYQH